MEHCKWQFYVSPWDNNDCTVGTVAGQPAADHDTGDKPKVSFFFF